MKIFDTNEPITSDLIPRLKASGIEGVIRYIASWSDGGKRVEPGEAHLLEAAGIKLALVFEDWGGEGNFQHGDISAASGHVHAKIAIERAALVGAPPGTIIYFAIDTDCTSGQYSAYVRPYATAVKATLLGKYRVGLYACGYVCVMGLAETLLDAAWLTMSMGFNGSRAFRDSGRATLVQSINGPAFGRDVDPDTANVPDWGGFVPFSVAPAPPSPAPLPIPSPTPVPSPIPSPSPMPVPSSVRIAGLLPETVHAIVTAAVASPVLRHDWNNGQAPWGYTKGMAVAFGVAYARLKANRPDVTAMAAAKSGDSGIDALSWYAGIFDRLGMSNATAGPDTLRHLWTLQTGLGMRESGGDYTCGRDMSASNVTSDTAEAGLFQQSWNFRSASPLLPQMFTDECARPEDDEQSLQTIFKEGATGVYATRDYGSGDGLIFQHLCKTRPLFAAMTAAVGLRGIRSHWGPIDNYQAEVLPVVDELYKKVQSLVDAEAPVTKLSSGLVTATQSKKSSRFDRLLSSRQPVE